MNKIEALKQKILFKEIVIENKDHRSQIIKAPRSKAPFVLLLVVAIFLICYLFLNTGNNRIRLSEFGEIFIALFKPSMWGLKNSEGYFNFLFHRAIPKIFDTVKMVYISTILGVILSIPLYILASENVVKKKRIFMPIRIIINIIRTIPTFVLAIIGTIFYGIGEAAGIFAMTIFTLGIMFKLMYEYIETVDMNPFEAIISAGGNRMDAYNLSIRPQTKPMFISNIIYIFEINIRASVILGFVGAGGIGQLLSDSMESSQYDKVGAILIPLFILVMILQLISSALRRRVK
jgi:phosphonate transport system permease protein